MFRLTGSVVKGLNKRDKRVATKVKGKVLLEGSANMRVFGLDMEALAKKQ